MRSLQKVIPIRTLVIVYGITLAIFIISTIIGYLFFNFFKNFLNVEEFEQQLGIYISSPFLIFLNNVLVASLMNIPFIGPFFYIASISMTGVILGTIIQFKVQKLMLDPNLALIIGIGASTLLPHGILEFSAYSLSLINSMHISLFIINLFKKNRSNLSERVVVWFIRYAIVVVTLLIAAFLEFLGIMLMTS